MKILSLVLLLSLAIISFAEETKTNNDNRHDLSNDTIYWQHYLAESEALSKEFQPIAESLRNKEQSGIKVDWNEDYYKPLFEKTKKATLRFTQKEDLRSAFESLLLHGYYPLYNQQEQQLYSDGRGQHLYEKINFAYLPVQYCRGLDIIRIINLIIVKERRKEIVQGTFYGDMEKQKKIINERIENSDGTWVGMLGVDVYHKLLQFEYPILAGTPLSPPLGYIVDGVPNPFLRGTHTLDGPFPIIVIWSYKDDRARDFLFELATSSEGFYDHIADQAIYFLTLFPNSGELQPKVKILLKEKITKARQDEPNWSERLFNENGELKDPTMQQLHKVLSELSGLSHQKNTHVTFFTIGRLLALRQALEFNEKIPAEERERYNIVRRELAISWFLDAGSASHVPVKHSVMLQKGDEHFEVYFSEYIDNPCFFVWENEGNFYPFSTGNPDWQKRKMLYEHELAHPRPIYTKNQIEYLKTRIKELER